MNANRQGVMSEDIIWLGSAPAEEDCVQSLDPDYARKAKAECRSFIEAIRKVCGREPEGARLTIKGQPHDFGTYFECAVIFDGDNHAAAEYAIKCENQAPTRWEDAGMSPPELGGGLRR
jgi:hypothetical protein